MMPALVTGRSPARPHDADRYLGLASVVAGLLGIIVLSSALIALAG
jgi:hypothetical protein